MKVSDKFNLPVELKDWKPGSYDKRHYGIEHKHPKTGKDVYHTGTDIKLPFGKNVRAIADGEIVRIDYNPLEYGRLIAVKHQLSKNPNDVIFSLYMHLSNHDRHRNKSIDAKDNRFIKRGQWLGDVGADDENGDGEEHLHFSIYRDEAPQEGNGVYSHVFVGYGKLKHEINLKGTSHVERIDTYRTLERIGGNAIDPVSFMDTHLTRPIGLPEPIAIFPIKSSADPKNSGKVFFEKKFQRPRNGRYILKFSGRAKNGKQNYPNKSRGDDDDGWWMINGVDPRSVLDRIFQGPYEMNGAVSKNFPQDFFLFVNTKSSFSELSVLDQAEQVFTFYADESPFIETVEVLPWDDEHEVTFDFFQEAPISPVQAGGLPWKTFLMLGCPAKSTEISASAKSALMCTTSDDQGMKLIQNGYSVKHTLFPDSKKYGNWPISGDQAKGAVQTVPIPAFPKQAFNALELWVDNQPMLERVTFRF